MCVKMVIVMRKDLGMSRGKLVSQGSHAVLAVILDLFEKCSVSDFCKKKYVKYQARFEKNGAINKWLNCSFTKIVLRVNSEKELLELYNKIKKTNIPISLIKDDGRTEFGRPEYTCIAIGPDYEEKINEFTGHLQLYK